MHHQDEQWNRISTDMMIEITYMKHGNGPGGIIGTTTKPRSVQIWSNSLPPCNDLLRDLDELRGRYLTQKIIHKEEAVARITADMIAEKHWTECYSCALIRLTWHHLTHLFWWTYILMKSVQIRTTFTNQFKLGTNKWKSSKRVSLMGFIQHFPKRS